ncbi:MAG: tetratricopeptide repeat protein [bacterium]
MIRIKIVVLLLLSASLLFAKAGPLRMGDHLMSRGEYSSALAEYRKAEAENPDDPEVLWRIGSAMTRLAYGIQGGARHDSLEVATNYLNRAIVGNSGILQAHLEYARALGNLALFKPDWDDNRVARRVREELSLVLDEEPDNPDALYLMALWHKWVCPKPMLERKPTGLGPACIDSAAFYLRRAEKQEKENLEFKLELARVYIAMDNEAAAKEILRDVISAKDVPNMYSDLPKQAEMMLYMMENPESAPEETQ